MAKAATLSAEALESANTRKRRKVRAYVLREAGADRDILRGVRTGRVVRQGTHRQASDDIADDAATVNEGPKEEEEGDDSDVGEEV